MIRPMLATDVAPLVEVQHQTFDDLARRINEAPFELTPDTRERLTARMAHLQASDPESAWAAEVDGELVGCALALVRDGMWFLSLLMVKPGYQGKGIGRELLDASLTTSTDRSWILSTVEPAAVRRYQRAGFALHPTYSAKGVPDRAAIPAVSGVRVGGDEHAETMDQVLRVLRGAGLGAEAGFYAERGSSIAVVPGKGFAVLRPLGTAWLGAVDEATARDLLWTVLAEATEPVEIDWLGADQQWGVDVCLDARLTLGAGASVCLRGQPTMSPYLPSGAFG
ncbi:MAG TPA: GNAT family N-acetyltransferase [Mycobacteriales bacterium]|nr:GNAT family N-acetyltransferase [Mycobacteriales bacterium]